MLNSVQLSPTYFLEPVKFHNDTRNSIYRKARLAIFNSFSYWPYFFVWLVLSLFNRACKINCRKIPRVFRDTRVSHIVSQIALFTNNTNSSVCIPTCSFSLQNLYIVQRQVLRLKKIINYIRFFSSLTAKFSNSSPLHSPPEEFENVGFTVKTQQIFSFHITSEEFKNTTIYRSCWIRLYLMKTQSGKFHGYRTGVVEKLRFQKIFRSHWNENPPFSNSCDLKSVFEKLR